MNLRKDQYLLDDLSCQLDKSSHASCADFVCWCTSTFSLFFCVLCVLSFGYSLGDSLPPFLGFSVSYLLGTLYLGFLIISSISSDHFPSFENVENFVLS